jgi:hypothetical protein
MQIKIDLKESALAVGVGDIEYVNAGSHGLIAHGFHRVRDVGDEGTGERTAEYRSESIKTESRGKSHPLVPHLRSNYRGALEAVGGQCIA